MIESPLLQKMLAERIHEVILGILKKRFTTVPREVTRLLRAVPGEERLQTLSILAATCPDMNAFRNALLS